MLVMPKALSTLRATLNSLRDSVFRGLFRARFRYDVFISYNHSAKDYALNLKKQLSDLDFTCFFDEEESPPGLSLDPTLEKALRKSAVLVLLATERALTRPYIALEFERFVATNRRIIPINISEALTRNNEAALTKTPWNTIKSQKLIWIDETAEAFDKKIPSPSIADGIDKLFKYTRRNVRVRTEIIGTAVLVLLAAFGAVFVITGKNKELATQNRLLETAKTETAQQQTVAANARADAQTQLALAKQAKLEADQAKLDADKAKADALAQQEIAQKPAAEASRQRQLAAEAKQEAEKQQTIASARQLANQADLVRGESSNQLSTSTSLAIQSLELHPTLEGDIALRNNLGLLPLRTDEQTYQGKLTVAAVSPNGAAMAFLTSTSHLEIRRPGKAVVQKDRPAQHHLIALSNDGEFVATAGGNTARIQSIEGRQSWDIDIFDEANIRAIALSRGGRYLGIVASADESLWVDVGERDSRKLIGKPIRGHVDFMDLTSVAFSSDQEELIAVGGLEKKDGGINGFLKTWLIQEERGPRNECLKDECKATTKYVFVAQSTLRPPISVRMIALTSGDNYLLSASHFDALVWRRTRLGDYREIARVPLDHPLALAFDQGAAHVHVVSQPPGWIDGAPVETDKTVQIWEASGQRAQTQLTDEILAVSFLPDSHLLTTLSKTFGEEENGIRIWDAKDVQEKGQDEVALGLRSLFDFSADGRYLAFADEHGSVHVRDLVYKMNCGDGLTTSRLKYIKRIGLSYDGKFMVLAGPGPNDDPKLVVYQRLTGTYKESSSFTLPHDTPLDVLALSPDGNLVATPTPGVYQVKIWNAKTGRDVTPKPLVSGAEVRVILFSPRGGMLAAASTGNSTIVWAVASGRTVTSLSGSTWADSNASHNIAFSQDERLIAIGNSDGTAKVFEASTGQELAILKHRDPVVSVSFSSDAKYLATATTAVDPDTAQRESYALQTWLIQPRDLIAEACRRSRPSCEEPKNRTSPSRSK